MPRWVIHRRSCQVPEEASLATEMVLIRETRHQGYSSQKPEGTTPLNPDGGGEVTIHPSSSDSSGIGHTPSRVVSKPLPPGRDYGSSMVPQRCHMGAGLGWRSFWLGTVGIQLMGSRHFGAVTLPILSKNASRLQPWPPAAEAPSQEDLRLGIFIATHRGHKCQKVWLLG